MAYIIQENLVIQTNEQESQQSEYEKNKAAANRALREAKELIEERKNKFQKAMRDNGSQSVVVFKKKVN